ncbi:MAG: hypothetical protein NW201_04960, partial [Gemmatimonadales bacterium]|nr:hypothetical protein [Gemmatimonadales bacterium]
MPVAAFVLQLAGALPTVGDTVWLERWTRLAPEARVTAPAWAPALPVLRLGAPRVERRADGAWLRWPVAVMAAGTHVVPVPGPLVLRADGGVDTVAASAQVVSVASVLPPGPRDAITPAPPPPPLPLTERRVAPVLAGTLVPLALVAAAARRWRRRGRDAAAEAARAADDPIASAERWIALGEPA